MAAAASSSSATACFLSPCPPPRRARHSLRHLACAAAAKPAGASRSLALPLPSPWPRRLAGLVPAEAGRLLSSAAGSLIVALASAALILGDVGAASAFVVATPRKLQADELATVRLFQENTPSVVYITNLAVRYTPATPSPFPSCPAPAGLCVVCHCPQLASAGNRTFLTYFVLVRCDAGRTRSRSMSLRFPKGPGRGSSGIRAATSSPTSMSSAVRPTSGWLVQTSESLFLSSLFSLVLLGLSISEINDVYPSWFSNYLNYCNEILLSWGNAINGSQYPRKL